ncbi:MAG: hypothetical protein ACI4QD_02405 [Kiritimatiellia bacterium]
MPAYLSIAGKGFFASSGSVTRPPAPQLKFHLAEGWFDGISKTGSRAMLRRIRRPEAPESLLWNWSPIPVGEPNIAYAAYFSGRSYLTPLARSPVGSEGDTFKPFCRND